MSLSSLSRANIFNKRPAAALLQLAWPMIVGNVLQQLYNLVDALIVGRYIGLQALAAVGAATSLMVFLTSVLIGLGLGLSVALGQNIGAGNERDYLEDMRHGLFLMTGVTVIVQLLSFALLPLLLKLLRIDALIMNMTASYLKYMFAGMLLVCLYNYLAAFLRSLGDTLRPLIALACAAVTNIVLDYLFVKIVNLGIDGAAIATLLAQGLSVLLLFLMAWRRSGALAMLLRLRPFFAVKAYYLQRLLKLSLLSAVQQSVMNFGILLIQSLVNSYGYAVTAAFTAAQRVDAFAYMPVQDFGNAFAILIAHHSGAKAYDKLRRTRRGAFALSSAFSLLISLIILLSAPNLIRLFLQEPTREILTIATDYLYKVATFYVGIAWLFLWYGYFRATDKVTVSIVLTVISLGLRVLIAYSCAPFFGVGAIAAAIIIGWFIADLTGFVLMRRYEKAYFNKT